LRGDLEVCKTVWSLGGIGMRRKIIHYDPRLKGIARRLRNEAPLAEKLLWQHLKGKQMLDYDFHRQKPLDQYVVDFFCNELMLAIEVDGEQHFSDEQIRRDKARQATLERIGIRFLRFTNEDVKRNIQGVLAKIEEWILSNSKKID